MQFYTVNPLEEETRWNAFVTSHPRSSVFHQTGWLRALSRTYGYRPVALTTASAGAPLLNGIVFCEVSSWITGKRMVSLPFSDHVDPLLNDTCDSPELERWIRSFFKQKGFKYIELRPLSLEARPNSVLVPAQSFYWHTLDLRPSLRQLFEGLHKDCFQRRIRHAEHEHLVYERGNSDKLLSEFYKLLLNTRRRHRALPQPRAWFRNLICEKSLNPEIRLVRKSGTPVASLFTLRHRGAVVYKYGCSNEEFHHLGGMPFLFWRLIDESKGEGAGSIDLGRTDTENRGLVQFKNRLGAACRKITYFRYPPDTKASWTASSPVVGLRWLASSIPNPLLAGLGRLAYRHFG